MSGKPLDIDKIASKAENIYEAIVVMSKRARQVNEELKIEFNQRIELLQTRTVNPEEENEPEPEQPVTNPEQILIAQDFEHRPKPTETAVQEMTDGKLNFRYKNEDPVSPAN